MHALSHQVLIAHDPHQLTEQIMNKVHNALRQTKTVMRQRQDET